MKAKKPQAIDVGILEYSHNQGCFHLNRTGYMENSNSYQTLLPCVTHEFYMRFCKYMVRKYKGLFAFGKNNTKLAPSFIAVEFELQDYIMKNK